MNSILLALALTLSTTTSVFAADATPTAAQAAVQRANESQVQALAKGDPTVMRDLATDGYYQDLVQTNRALAGGGVKSIELVKIEWGESNVAGNTARVTAYETWRTVYEDGTTEDARDRNDYTLVQVNGAWKIQADDHPQDEAAGNTSVPVAPPTRPIRTSPAGGRGTSGNWSGYVAQGTGYSAVTGTWTIPQPSAANSWGADGAWVGIGGFGSEDLIQAGTGTEVAPNGRMRYQAWVEMLPAPPQTLPLPVKPGDSVTFALAETSPTQWTITAKNNTTGQTVSVDEQYESSHTSAEWIEEAPATPRGLLPLTSFEQIDFTAGSVVHDGKTQSLAAAGALPITMVDNAGRPIAQPSTLGPEGSAFSVSRIDQPATEEVQPVRPRRGRRGGI
jgi:hypothetical protein